jgi:hypothetical protein
MGLMGNPVFLGALSAGAIAVVARRVGRSGPWLRWIAVVGLLAGAAQLSGSRSAVGLAAVAVLAALRGAGPRRGAALVAAVAVAFLLAPAWAGGSTVTGSSRTLGTDSTAQFGTRIGFWRIGAEATIERPILGWGPGRFEAATGPRYTAAISEGGVNVFKDAHNWVVEYGVTTGLVGLALLLAWLALAGRAAKGPLAGFAVVAGVFMLVEPLSVALAPLALLALGVASDPVPERVPPTRAWRVATALGLAAGFAAAGVFLAGEAFLRQGQLDTSPASIQRASRLLPPWADVSRLGARTESFAGLHDEVHRRRALALAAQATRREPSDAWAWAYLGRLELLWGNEADATRAIDQSLRANPWVADGLVSSAALGRRTGDQVRVARACDRLRVLGTTPAVCGGPATVQP